MDVRFSVYEFSHTEQFSLNQLTFVEGYCVPLILNMIVLSVVKEFVVFLILLLKSWL